MNRTVARGEVFKLIFSLGIVKDTNNIEKTVENFIEYNEITSPKMCEYITNTYNGVVSHLDEIDNLIKVNLKSEWTIDRISKIDIAILRLAIYELSYVDIPFKVSINEAIELTKTYGDDNSSLFVNGILAEIVKILGKMQ